MLKRLWLLFFALSWLVTACQGAATPRTQVESPPPPVAADSSPSPTSTQTETPTGEPTSGVSTGSETQCTLVSLRPTPGPTEASLFPPVSDSDWVEGPASAEITFIEYSDFQ
jgi:hypothetical protein